MATYQFCDHNQYQSLLKTIQSSSQSVATLQATNVALTKTITTLTQTVNDTNLRRIAQSLQSVSSTLHSLSHSKSSNLSQITSYFSQINTKSNSTSPSPQTKPFHITSLTIAQFVRNEGSQIFSLQPYHPPLSLYSDGNRYKFQCKICSKFDHHTQGRVKYIEGDILTEQEIHSRKYLKSVKRGIQKHVSCTNTHLSSVALSKAMETPSQALYIKIETVFFIIKRSLPWVVFEEIMIFLHRLIEYFECSKHDNCLDIGDKQHSVWEARRIVGVFEDVTKKQIIYVIHSPSYSNNVPNIIYLSISIDGWSKS